MTNLLELFKIFLRKSSIIENYFLRTKTLNISQDLSNHIVLKELNDKLLENLEIYLFIYLNI